MVTFSEGTKPRLVHILYFPLERLANMTTKGARGALRGKAHEGNS